ncbi:MAG: glycosyltransferase family 1 protein [Candidatus Latescibacterota bacterium]
MRVGITTAGADGGRSGIGQYLLQLLRHLDRGGGEDAFEVLVCRDEQEVFVPPGSSLIPVPIASRLRQPLLSVAWHQALLPGVCRRRGYDVLFLPAANRRVPLHVGCPTVGTVHDLSSLHVEGKYDAARVFYVRRVLPFLIRRLDQVITVSHSSKADIVEHARVSDERVTVIPLAADPARYFPRPRHEASQQVAHTLGLQRPYILYLARLEHPGKNHVRLIRAFARLKEDGSLPHQLVLAGGDWTRAEEIHRAAQESPCSRHIRFLGFVPEAAKPELYAAAEAFVYPSLYEGFGLPLLEAMACGTPVACADTSSLPEVAGGAALLFDPGDEEAMAHALRLLLTDTDIWCRYARRGLERSGQFAWERTAARTLEVVRRAAAARLAMA